MRTCRLFLAAIALLYTVPARSLAAPYQDRIFASKVFQCDRHYRIFLPPDYETGQKRYPVIYYFHGHGDRYTLEKYDHGTDTVPKIARFVAHHDAIVVAVDGYVPEHDTGFYGGSPWDARKDGGTYDFGAYFLEMVAHVDATYRTRTSRRYRATCGLSMGGFMSLYLSARYPQTIGSASAFNPAPELYVGDRGCRVLWRPKDHVANHGHSMIRLVRASGDYISQYHEETHAAYANADDVDFEYRRDEYHRHWATSVGETFAFHMRAFANSRLDGYPGTFHHANAYRHFSVWGYEVRRDREVRAIVYLSDVRQGGFRLTTRSWAPDGPAIGAVKPTAKPRGSPPAGKQSSRPMGFRDRPTIIRVKTAPRYVPRQTYRVADHSLSSHETVWSEVAADGTGRIAFRTDGAGHQFSLIGPGIAGHRPVLLPVTNKDKLRLRPGRGVTIPLQIYNPGAQSLRNVAVVLSSEYPTVEWLRSTAHIARIGPGKVADLGKSIAVRFTAGDGTFAPTRLVVTISAEGFPPRHQPLDVLVIPASLPHPVALEILDGRTRSFSVFHQRGNQGGGYPVTRTVHEGTGNGDGVLQPGEEATFWVRTRQGLDPFDKNNWCRAKVYTDSRWIEEVKDLQEPKEREWTGAMLRSSVVRLARDVPPGTHVPLVLDSETWSFRFTPDVRYGRERLYQAFQFHRHHVHGYTIDVPAHREPSP